MLKDILAGSPRRRRGGALLILATLGPIDGAGDLPGQESPEVERLLRGRVEALRSGAGVMAAGDRLLARGALLDFYESRGFATVWTSGSGAASRLSELLEAVRSSRAHGLDPADYHLQALETLGRRVLGRMSDPVDRVDLELVASDAFLVLGSHLLHGRVNPETIDPEWLANRRSAKMHDVLDEAVRSGRIRRSLEGLAPQQRGYRALARKLQELRAAAMAGGFPLVEGGPPLEEGRRDPRVPGLRARLAMSGDLRGSTPAGDTFDPSLAEAVSRFQRRHGLVVDGVVGAATLAALNLPASERVRQVEINMERWRWLPDDLGARHIEVNIAGFDARVVEDGRTVRRHRAVVGRQYRQTPIFSSNMTYLVLAPYWHVPPTIAAVDKLPLIKADPSVLAAQRMTLLDGASNLPVDPATVDWPALTGTEFNRRYRLRQDPGPANALGGVKFMFPNRYNVYLHDTPTRELFARASRSFSSGCIRIENPLELAAYLLADQPEWTPSRIAEVAAGGIERSIRLTRPLPVHLLYWTAWADEEGVVHFRDDIYGRDRTVHAALVADPPVG